MTSRGNRPSYGSTTEGRKTNDLRSVQEGRRGEEKGGGDRRGRGIERTIVFTALEEKSLERDESLYHRASEFSRQSRDWSRFYPFSVQCAQRRSKNRRRIDGPSRSLGFSEKEGKTFPGIAVLRRRPSASSRANSEAIQEIIERRNFVEEKEALGFLRPEIFRGTLFLVVLSHRCIFNLRSRDTREIIPTDDKLCRSAVFALLLGKNLATKI